SEPSDVFAVLLGLLQPELSNGAQMLRAERKTHFRKCNTALGTLQMVRPLRVYQRQGKEHFLPIVAQGFVVAVGQTLLGKGERHGVESECLRRACVKSAGKLVHDDDQGEPSARRACPSFEFPACPRFEDRSELR